MFGSHLSIAGGMHLALEAAAEYGMDCVQVFTKNQQQWKCKPLQPDAIALWHEARERTGMDAVVSHNSYLINMASPKDELWVKSVDLMEEEIRRCDQLDIPWLVAHPSSHTGIGEEAGIERIAKAINELHQRQPDSPTTICLEVTAGQGSSIGYRLEHLREIRGRVKQLERVAYCLDSAHLIAAGYDLTSAMGANIVIAEIDAVLGLEMVKVWHLNDSKVPLGKRVDRHEHIGFGTIALDAFKAIINCPAFKDVPKILETAKEKNEAGEDWDAVNLRTLRGLMTRSGHRGNSFSRKKVARKK